jgi:pyruvate/2-oxoglutarate dehydrogenase complex dihydrolipoamide acyltransferase (E2) component
MPFWYFLRIPPLPVEVEHQSNTVEIRKYLVSENDSIKSGTVIAAVENYWTEMNVKANGRGFVQRTFFRPGQAVRVGDPIAIVGADGEEVPCGRPEWTIEILKLKRKKPS